MQDGCKARADEVAKVISEARTQWDRLGTYIDETERSFLASRLPSLHKWFGLEEEDLSNWIPGGLRCTVHDRVQMLLITPLVEKMCQRVTFSSPFRQAEKETAAGEEGEFCGNVLERIAEHYDKYLKPAIDQAKSADTALTKKIKKTEKDERAKGIVALGMQDTKRVAALKRERPQIWEPVQELLEAFATPGKHLKAFLVDELAEEMVARKAGAVAVVASRAICDWMFQRSCMEYRQLQEWWRRTKATLQQRERLWKRLMEKEGILIRRIELGIDDVGAKKGRYSVYATFGGSEMEVMSLFSSPGACITPDPNGELPPKLQESVNLLSTVVSDMAKRLKAIRDSALWRVIETARSIHGELCVEDSNEEASPWQAATPSAGAAALIEELGWAQDESAGSRSGTPAADESGIVDAALASMGRLERLGVVTSEMLAFFRQEHATDGKDVSSVLAEVAQSVHSLCEELLLLMDEPTRAAGKAWLQQFDASFASSVGGGPRLESAMAALPLKKDSEINPRDRAARKRRLLLTRGIKIFLEDEALRAQAVLPLSRVAEPRGARGAAAARPAALASSRRAQLPEQEEDSILELLAPPSPRVVPGLSGGGGNPQRSPPESSRGSARSRGGYPQQPQGSPQQSSRGSPLSRGHDVAAWPPETPSTTCDDASAAVKPPTSKFVEGQCVFLRPDSPAVRLSPLTPKSRKASSPSLVLELSPPP